MLAVGDLGPRKNLTALGAAVGGLGDRDLVLALVGKPGRGGERIAAESGGRWLGHVSDADLADLYRAAAVTAYPSLYEGFGLPVVEAMACGSPVVASDRGAIPEVAGDAAILVEPSARGIALGLRAALDPEVAARLRAAGPVRAGAYTPGGHGPRGVGGGAGGGGGVRIAMVGTRGIPAAYSGFETAVEHLAAAVRGPRPRGDGLLPPPHDRAPRHVRRGAPGAPADRAQQAPRHAGPHAGEHRPPRDPGPPGRGALLHRRQRAGGAARAPGRDPGGAADRRARLGAGQVVGPREGVPALGGADRAVRRHRSP